MSLALGEMSMSVEEFWDMEPVEFELKYQGFNKQQEAIKRDAWERDRFFNTAQINMQLEKGKKIRPVDLVKFSWEKQDEAKQVPLDRKAYFEQLKERYK